eukprot:CAMPEP_0201595464 /NCGR_PEP_ID=MMETSP0190_2-20130828/192460_1 /ASSEMBLY_ACC=CAM_ASM_000263 /TAXON_ID=37353 /ORGANISM="Rosalina sp." /LENGTH=101 /DNA_ID=CAMNT_0048055463 /DNA_START=805 /DNA_END=1110 /DNA_ORIENTATION=-
MFVIFRESQYRKSIKNILKLIKPKRDEDIPSVTPPETTGDPTSTSHSWKSHESSSDQPVSLIVHNTNDNSDTEDEACKPMMDYGDEMDHNLDDIQSVDNSL